jgi:hypothetical protein
VNQTTALPFAEAPQHVLMKGAHRLPVALHRAASEDLLPESWSMRSVRFLDTLHFEEDSWQFTEEQIAFALRQRESGTVVAEITRKMGISEQSFYRWKAAVRRSRRGRVASAGRILRPIPERAVEKKSPAHGQSHCPRVRPASVCQDGSALQQAVDTFVDRAAASTATATGFCERPRKRACAKPGSCC